MSVAETIRDQLPRGFGAMIGVKNLIGLDNGLDIRFKARAKNGINRIVITLNALDLYDVSYERVTNGKAGFKQTIKATSEGLYNDMLKTDIETTTELYLSL